MAARKSAKPAKQSPPPPDIELTAKQSKCLFSTAQIIIVGGGNGGGKSQALMFAAMQHLATPGYDAVLFMESAEKVKMPGGLLDRSKKLYAPLTSAGLDALNRTDKRWRFPTHGVESSISLSYVGDPGRWDGLEACFIGVDQVEQITQGQFESVVGRCRSTCGAPRRVIASANPPGPDHWLTRLLLAGGWIGADGYPRPEMDGVVRYFARSGDEYVFRDSPEELAPYLQPDATGAPIPPKSMTFVGALVDDNRFGDPQYKAELASLSEVERLRRLRGNWLVTEEAGKYFKAEFFPLRDQPAGPKAQRLRSWDNAWSDGEGADWTVGVLLAFEPSGQIVVEDVIRLRGSAAVVERAIELVAQVDGPRVPIRLPKDAGQGGKEQSAWARKLGAKGYTVVQSADRGDKLERSKPYQACCERRQVALCRSHPSSLVAQTLTEPWTLPDGSAIAGTEVSTLHGWHAGFISEHVGFGKRSASGKLLGKKDQVDAVVAGYLWLSARERPPAAQVHRTLAVMGAAARELDRAWGGEEAVF